MGGGLIQLVAYGAEDLYLTDDPQITFFKMVYKRHTNFSTESIPQYFNQKLDFGKRVTCTLSKNGDLVGQIYLHVVLPSIPQFVNSSDGEVNDIYKFAWIKKIGYGMIKTIDIEIGGHIIDRHYGDWLNIWFELSRNHNKTGINEMIGNLSDVYSMENGKDSITLFIPLEFWFCRENGLALPMVALKYSDIKIHVELNNAYDCYILGPTNYIAIDDEVVHFDDYEYITQTVNGVTNVGMFIYHDIINKRLYYLKIDGTFLAPSSSLYDYTITGSTTDSICTPQSSVLEQRVNVRLTNEPTITSACLYVDFIFLDNEERLRFVQSNHEYLIDQVQCDGDHILISTMSKLKLGYNHPCKELIWRCQFDYIGSSNFKDKFNYTNSYDKDNGINIVKRGKLLLNGHERFKEKNTEYFNWVQPYQTHSNAPSEGINVYSFALKPEDHQPSGSCNLSRIDDAALELYLDRNISYSKPAKIRVYARTYNVLRVINGLGGVAFEN